MYLYACLKIGSVLLLVHLAIVRCASTQNYPVATTEAIITTASDLSNYEREMQQSSREGRGMDMDVMDYDNGDHDHDHAMDHDHDDHHDMQEQKAVKQDPWAGYYDFIINEGSFKFWAVFQLVTALLLIYSAFAAVYYAKFNVISTDYDYYDDFFGRSADGAPPSSSPWLGLSSQTFQRIFNAISSKKYT